MYDLKTFTFGKGSHKSRKDGLCVMEAVAMLAGERHTDHPKCACPVINELAIWVNDSCDDKLRNELLRYLPWRIVGTKASADIQQKRAFMAVDWAIRVICPTLLDRAGLAIEANKLRLLPVVDSKAAEAAEAAARAAEAAEAAARAAGAAGAAEAAEAAAGAAEAAEAAARAAEAAEAARAAEAAGAAEAAEAARAAEAAGAADLEFIQRSCVELLDRMIKLTEPQEAAVCNQVGYCKVIYD